MRAHVEVWKDEVGETSFIIGFWTRKLGLLNGETPNTWFNYTLEGLTENQKSHGIKPIKLASSSGGGAWSNDSGNWYNHNHWVGKR